MRKDKEKALFWCYFSFICWRWIICFLKYLCKMNLPFYFLGFGHVLLKKNGIRKLCLAANSECSYFYFLWVVWSEKSVNIFFLFVKFWTFWNFRNFTVKHDFWNSIFKKNEKNFMIKMNRITVERKQSSWFTMNCLVE